jgi:hypothetical protein
MQLGFGYGGSKTLLGAPFTSGDGLRRSTSRSTEMSTLEVPSMPICVAGVPVSLSARHSSPRRARWSRRVYRAALPGATYALYVAVTIALLAQIATQSAELQDAGTSAAEPVLASGALVLTITIDGPGGPLKVYCDTTTDRVGSDEVNVSAAEAFKFYQETCSRVLPD